MRLPIVMLLLLVATFGKEFETIGAAANEDLAFLTEPSCAPQPEFDSTLLK